MDTAVKKTRLSKGERLNWEKTQRATSIKLTPDIVVGKFITEKEHNKLSSNNKRFLVP